MYAYELFLGSSGSSGTKVTSFVWLSAWSFSGSRSAGGVTDEWEGMGRSAVLAGMKPVRVTVRYSSVKPPWLVLVVANGKLRSGRSGSWWESEGWRMLLGESSAQAGVGMYSG